MLVTLCIATVSCSKINKEEEDVLKGKAVRLEAYANGEHAAVYSEDGSYYTYNYKTKESAIDSKDPNKELKLALILPEAKEQSKSTSNKFDDPSTIVSSIHGSTPYTFNATLLDSASYYAYVLNSGWVLDAEYRCPEYIDKYMVNGSANLRIIITEQTIKVFSNTEKKYMDCWTYINERR